MFLIRKVSGAYLGEERSDGFPNGLVQVGVLLHEFWIEVWIHSQEVIANQDLAIAVDARSDSNGWNFQALCHLTGQFEGNAFQHQGITLRLLENQRVSHNLTSGLVITPLNYIPP